MAFMDGAEAHSYKSSELSYESTQQNLEVFNYEKFYNKNSFSL